MSRYFPHAPYAEEQPLSRTILTTHVFTRALTMGTVAGIFTLPYIRILNRASSFPPPTLLRWAGTGSLVTLTLFTIGLPIRMFGREEIEWKDRAWRLMENKGQLECDDWTYSAMALSAAAAVGSKNIRGRGLIGQIGAVGVGSVLGMVGYMGWRHGIKRGKFDE